MNVLNATTIPLTGIRLIEASAGTGKTYTIASLYVRWVVGHECEPLSPENILVVTFTRAATEELRERIRARLKSTLKQIDSNTWQQDAFLEAVLKGLDLQVATQRLRDAIQVMDLAAIYTIHGFAQKVLKQFSVESNVDSEFEFVLDDTQWLIQAARDVWRQRVYPLTGDALNIILSEWRGPDDLLKSLRPLMKPGVQLSKRDFKEDLLKGALARFKEYSTNLKQRWLTESTKWISDIRNHTDASGSYTRFLDGRVEKINAWVASSDQWNSEAFKALGYFTPLALEKSVKKNGVPVLHDLAPLIQAMLDEWEMYQSQVKYYLMAWKLETVRAVQHRLATLKRQKGIVSSDDLLLNLSASLQQVPESQLADPLRAQFPVALVDEFQDTDGAQYEVFKRLYVHSAQRQSLALFMIGDPKQAIYKFRGADIFTYIEAKKDVDETYSLDTNYRSVQPLVTAVNTIFTQHTQPFLFDESIPFDSVKAHQGADCLPQAMTPFTWHFAPLDNLNISNQDQAISYFANITAQKVVELLQPNESGKLEAKDIAILVRSAKQAQVVKTALSERQVGCVYVGQDSVFQSQEAYALNALLHSIHAMSERQYRNALAHPVWELSLASLAAFSSDERHWEMALDRLYEANQIWMKQGVMSMVMHWLHAWELPSQWLSQPQGDRVLTNVLHLAEMLQNQSHQVQGMQGLLTWFDLQVFDEFEQADQKQLRLESDANLVQIVTVHKSKGLEYPVVFVPFNWMGKEGRDLIYYDEAIQSLTCDLDDEHLEKRKKESLAEEVRLLYVALTRASKACYVGMVDGAGLEKKPLGKDLKHSPLFHVLTHGQTENASTKLKELVSSSPQVFAIEQPEEALTILETVDSKEALSSRSVNLPGFESWQLSSFSALVRNLHTPHDKRFNLDDEWGNEIPSSEATPEPTEENPVLSAFDFPKGAHAGNFLHNLLEDIDFVTLPSNLDDIITNLLQRYGIDIHWQEVVKTWLPDILETPLTVHVRDTAESALPVLSLSQLDASKKAVEMEFYFPIAHLNAVEFNRLVQAHSILPLVEEQHLHDLNFQDVKGMLKGFIDLTFEWGGQYFILDYKSNHLGHSYSHYSDVAVQAAMAEHRYDVQLIIYTLALHRFLRLRLPDYDYDQHIGGGYYLFLRGLHSQGSEGQFFAKPSKTLIESLDALIAGEPLESTPLVKTTEVDTNDDHQMGWDW